MYDILKTIVHPVIIESSDSNYPYWGMGTAFIAQWGQYIFLISAKHIWKNQGITTENFRVILRESQKTLIFDREAIFKDAHSPEGDLVILRIHPETYETLSRLGIHWMDLNIEIKNTNPASEVHLVAGYPANLRDYDYENQRIIATLIVLVGEKTPPQINGLETLTIGRQAERECNDYNGYSGSPVIRYANDEMEFSGMVVMGTETSKLLHFIPAEQIIHYLHKLENMEATNKFL